MVKYKLGVPSAMKGRVGELSHFWKGGTRTYYVYVSRKALENYYGISWENMNLPNDATIHHIDKNFKNNTFNNLCVMSRSEHSKLHDLDRSKDNQGRYM